MTCPACTEAETDPHTVIKYMGCMQCDARSIAQSDEAKAREADPAALQALVRKVWPAEADYRKGRALVWEAIKQLEGQK
jgi:hypothetical protein